MNTRVNTSVAGASGAMFSPVVRASQPSPGWSRNATESRAWRHDARSGPAVSVVIAITARPAALDRARAVPLCRQGRASNNSTSRYRRKVGLMTAHSSTAATNTQRRDGRTSRLEMTRACMTTPKLPLQKTIGARPDTASMRTRQSTPFTGRRSAYHSSKARAGKNSKRM